ncbi:MAG: ABC transporter ATP-binding protein [Thaumarchaeota archaeon]|nr:ABC transporter ATP-binding protein [Nitrososphaerales archaeon]NSL73996.1 ABC transporter ATP-binding protein [Nitrososphaerota archaeon]NSL75335.1 ABC transporter ATP-binding protein [Nitrososphaerota archaeon]NSL77376.1 ABC transporter ATP-binding protein [Nitrososphaerota archaeon]
MFKVSGLHSGYDGTIIIEDIDLNVQTDEIVTIIGPNGSGKSTLLKSIFGIVKPQQGKIEFLNESIIGIKPFRVFEKGISYVPQVENIFSNLTISENLDIGFYTSKIKDTKNELDKIYSIFPQLKNKNSIKSGNLSGGERQMLAIARALIGDPKLLLLDEPTASLAPNLVSEIMQKLIQIKESGTSILLVEQNAKKSLAISDRCYVLAMGKNFFDGKASEVINNRELGRMFLGSK